MTINNESTNMYRFRLYTKSGLMFTGYAIQLPVKQLTKRWLWKNKPITIDVYKKLSKDRELFELYSTIVVRVKDVECFEYKTTSKPGTIEFLPELKVESVEETE